jgi:hypothetical protein
MPTHFLGGVSTASATNPLHQFGMPDPTKWQVFFDDFIHEPFSTEWTITATSVGTGTSAISTPDLAGGCARITTAANENDGLFAQTIGEVFLLVQGKKTFIKTRLQVGDAIQSDWIVGLHSTDTTPQDATTRFLFESVDGAAAVYFNNDNGTTDSDSSTVATLADDTFITLGAYYDGAGIIRLYADDVHITTMGTRASPITVTGAEMAVGFGYLNGAAGAETTDIDYIFVAQER